MYTKQIILLLLSLLTLQINSRAQKPVKRFYSPASPVYIKPEEPSLSENGNVMLWAMNSEAEAKDWSFQWYKDGKAIPNEKARNYLATSTGYYYATVNLFYKETNSYKPANSNIVKVIAYTKPQLPACAINFTKSNFGVFHPCGVAISKQGKVAISTYEGDKNIGQLFIWNNFNDFNSEKCADFQYQINDPEGVAFDNNETLFISDTYNGKIYYTTNITVAPTKFFFISGDGNGNGHTNWNPRGLTVDASNNLYVMCENLDPVSPSVVTKVAGAIGAIPIKTAVTGSQQTRENALGICVIGNKLCTTDYYGHAVNVYNNSGNNITLQYALKPKNPKIVNDPYDPGNVLDVTSDGMYAYFTNAGGYLVKWNILNNDDTKSINIGATPNYAPWGVALYGNSLIVADAVHNKIQVFDKNNAPWQ